MWSIASHRMTLQILALLAALSSSVEAFFCGISPGSVSSSSRVGFLSAKGFGKAPDDTSKRPVPAKTYGTVSQTPIKDLIDSEAAMKDFFSSREEWTPVFRFLAGAHCQAQSFIGSSNEVIDFHETSEPWRRLEGIPKDEDDRQELAGFLDFVHQALLDIPVTASTGEDDNDLHFLEEGRRLLAISRFHVLRDNYGGSVEAYDDLFSTCWSEIMHLTSSKQVHTGSLIVLPNYELADLRRFTDMNLLRPLEWLGVVGDFEIASMERQSPAIRLLYKLNDMPDVPETTDENSSVSDL